MKTKFIEAYKNFDVRFFEDDTMQAKAIAITFGTICAGALLGAFLNPAQIIIALLSGAMITISYNSLNK